MNLWTRRNLFALPLAAAAFSLQLAAQEPAAAPAPSDARGFLYGKVTTEGGTTYQGRLRWGQQEAFWGDFFNSTKRDRPYEDDVPRRDRRRRKPIEIFGVNIGVSVDLDANRQFVARFGDVARLERGRGEDLTVVMKTGTRQRVRGGSNDVEKDTKVTVWDAGAGEVQLAWGSIRTVELLPAPAGLRVADQRLYGTVKSDSGEFRGFLQWDQDECLASDKLDGETRDGELALPMGNLRAIERAGRGRSKVILKDGRELTMTGTNDVDNDNRGVYVDDARYGRVLVPWDAFRRVDFQPAPGSGPGYEEYRHGRPIVGRVVAADGQAYAGRVVFDADEAETWEMLNGSQQGVEYSIPFALVETIVPDGEKASRVRLRGGAELVLEESGDVNEDNAGVLVYAVGAGKEKEAPRYLPWPEVKRVEIGER